MEKRYCWHGNSTIAQALNGLPRKIMNMRERDNVAEFVLHELCDKNCFDITKAAYFVDNPDFDCMRGVAGFSTHESFKQPDIWSCPDDFSGHMNQAAFNKKVRDVRSQSCKKHHESYDKVLGPIARDLGMESYGICDIRMPHDNHGYFVYEYGNEADEKERECLLNGVSLLSFCPLY
jgi:hypothetical protein